MPDLKISQLAAGTTPLAGTELVPIVQSGVTSRTTVGAIMTSTVPSGTANGVLFLNGSKVATSGTDLVFNATGLGIGTSSPSVRLHAYSATAMKQLTVDGIGSIKTGINFANSGTTYGQIYFDNNAPYDVSVVQQYTTGSLIFGTNGTERARITSGGGLYVGQIVGVGAERLGVTTTGATQAASFRNKDASKDTIFIWSDTTSGTNQFVGFYTDALQPRGSITYNRGAGQVAYNITSDVRLKKNIADANDAGSKVDALQVRQFDWKETGNHVDYGFVAQELEPIVPHAVSKPEAEDGMWSVDYSKLVPMLIKEIQSLRARVTALESN